VMTADEFDDLLESKFGLRRDDMLAALRTMPSIRPWATQLTDKEAQLLDQAGFTEDPDAYATVAADVLAHTGLLINTAVTTDAVAKALGVNESRVRQRRLEGSLWAIDDNGRWLYPVMQFDTDPKTGQTRGQIRGLDQVFRALPRDLHPVAVAGFLRTPHPDLTLANRPLSPIEWLSSGGDVAPVLHVAEAADWASR
jgi:hypothetical protein